MLGRRCDTYWPEVSVDIRYDVCMHKAEAKVNAAGGGRAVPTEGVPDLSAGYSRAS